MRILTTLVPVLLLSACDRTSTTVVVAGGPKPAPLQAPPEAVEKPHPHPGGPPPHAPAHGYRHKHSDGAELEYDSAVSAYAVAGMADHWFCDGWFFRWKDGVWQMGLKIDGDWKAAADASVPKGLYTRPLSPVRPAHPGKGKGKGRK